MGSEAGPLDVTSLLMDNWDPDYANGATGRNWGKPQDQKIQHGNYVCWDASGSQKPIALEEMSSEERAVRSPS